ncbi:MAG: SDR family oxidoreductase [Bacteroidota bacterium]|nr:SDR family oxidoreductase [Bacteroidota bacterium]
MKQIAVISGGSKGIGLALVKKFLEQDFTVFAISRNIGELNELQITYSNQLFHISADLSDKIATKEAAALIRSQISKVDVLINNAGVFLPGQIANEQEGDFELQMNLNVGSAYHLTRALLPLMYHQDISYVFNICSTASQTAYINGGSYCISKHALLGFSKVLRQELIDKNINVSAILPGATLTDSWSGTTLPEERFIKPENIAEMIYVFWLNRNNSCVEEITIRPVLGDI